MESSSEDDEEVDIASVASSSISFLLWISAFDRRDCIVQDLDDDVDDVVVEEEEGIDVDCCC